MDKLCADCKIKCNEFRCIECQKIFKNKIYLRNKDKQLKRQKLKREENPKKYQEYNKEYYQSNKEKLNNTAKAYKKKRRKEDPIFKFKENIRGVIGRGFRDKGFIKESRGYDILGCTYHEFKIYIESKFEDWMTWENYGIDKRTKIKPKMTWDIDHIIPLSTATTKEDVIRLNHYTNLQPLCSHYNRYVKGGYLE